jgi:hypothetical protein
VIVMRFSDCAETTTSAQQKADTVRSFMVAIQPAVGRAKTTSELPAAIATY